LAASTIAADLNPNDKALSHYRPEADISHFILNPPALLGPSLMVYFTVKLKSNDSKTATLNRKCIRLMVIYMDFITCFI
jgi:hypothetical protein